MTENELQQKVRDLIVELGFIAFWVDARTAGLFGITGWRPGFPDVVIIGPGGVLFRELKSSRGRLAEEQWAWGNKLLKEGQNWSAWRPEHWPEIIREELNRLAKV